MRTTVEETTTDTHLDISDFKIDDVAVPAEIIRNDEEAGVVLDANTVIGGDDIFASTSSNTSANGSDTIEGYGWCYYARFLFPIISFILLVLVSIQIRQHRSKD